MSQFQPPMDHVGEVPRTTSKLAVTAFVFSLILCCPVTTIVGPLLGLISLVTMGSQKKGRGFALSAIVLGVVFTAGQAFLGKYLWDNFYAKMFAGPYDALVAAETGDIAAFKAEFHGAGATASDAEIQAFADAVKEQFGAVQNVQFTGNQPTGGFSNPNQVFIYRIDFDKQSVDAEAELIFADPSTGQMVVKWGFIKLVGADGDVRFPPDPASP